jgi:hypothetical protein
MTATITIETTNPRLLDALIDLVDAHVDDLGTGGNGTAYDIAVRVETPASDMIWARDAEAINAANDVVDLTSRLADYVR